MHRAPTVEYPVGRSRFHDRTVLLLWLAAALVQVVWLMQADPVDWRPWMGLALVACLGAPLWLARLSMVQGSLVWDGRSWWWEQGGNRTEGGISPRLDLQTVVLLRFAPRSGSGRWLWLEDTNDKANWSAMRRAVHGATPDAAGGDVPAP